MKTAIIGDIHGCIDEFNELLNLLDYKSPNVRIISLGDLIDRGPESVAVVRRCRELDILVVQGNHEYKYLKWWRNSGSRIDVYDQKPHYTQFTDADINYMSRMAPYIRLEDQNMIVVHAGLRASVPLEKQSKDDLYYIRYVDEHHKFVSLKKINQAGSKEAVGAHFWTTFGPFGSNIVYGHNVHSLTDIRIDKYNDGTTCYGIDTGCCFGGKLSALIWETKEIVQVQAKQIYYRSTFEVR